MDEKETHTLTDEISSGNSPKKEPEKDKSDKNSAKELDKLKSDLDKLKKKIIDKFSFIKFLGILPQNSLGVFAEDEAMPREVEDTKPVLLMVCVPEDKFKEIPEIKKEIIEMIKSSGQNVWALIKTEVDLWHYGLDSKFELIDAVSAAYPLHDDGFLGSLRVANIHKSLVLRKFERYIATYAIGGSLVRGTAGKDSDVDAFVIIDDTDVKRMSRLELLEKLRGMIYDYIREATALAGVKNILNVQVYLLTDFWQSVKDATPVMFTFIRDGIPLYDRGTFIPWKRLLQMGKIQPSPEAVDNFMKSGEQTDSLVKRRLLDAMVDIYWGVVTPAQALMMLAGQSPPEPKIIVQQVKKVLVDKEKLMGLKELRVLEKAVKLFKDYEHGTLKEISGKEIDKFKKESEEYTKKVKELRKEIEERMQEHTAEKIKNELFSLLKTIFGNKSQGALILELDKNLVKTGKVQKRMLDVAKKISTINQKVKSKKLSPTEMQKISGESSELINAITEYAQRKDLVSAQKGVIQILHGGKKAEIVLTDDGAFIVEENSIKKVEGKKIIDSNKDDFENAIGKTRERLNFSVQSELFDILKKHYGSFEINI